MSHNPLRNCEDQPRCLPFIIEMCICAHTITTIKKKKNHITVFESVHICHLYLFYKFCCWKITTFQILWSNTVGPYSKPNYLYLHLWPVSNYIVSDPVPASTNWQTKSKKTTGLVCVSATSMHDRIDIYITAAEHYKTSSTASLLFVS